MLCFLSRRGAIKQVTTRTSAIEARALRETRLHVGQLLMSYPDVSQGQVREIVEFITTARELDLGLLMADELVALKLKEFTADHILEDQGRSQGPVMVAILTFMLAATVWFLGTYGVAPQTLMVQ